MKKLTLALSLAFGVAVSAEVPALINYQGRLVDGVGNPITGPKDFQLDIYDAQTEGTLIYQESLSDVVLDEDGAYSFQFGGGESYTQTSEIIANGDGETLLFQTPLENVPIGGITVTDGTNSFSLGDDATGEEPFTFLYVRGANRINLICNEAPAAGTSFTATYRYREASITGALSSAAEHWMEITIGDEKQSPRQRLVAVPFALKAGSLVETKATKSVKLVRYLSEYPWMSSIYYQPVNDTDALKIFEIPASAVYLKKISVPTGYGIRARVLRYDYDRTKNLLEDRITEIASFDNTEPVAQGDSKEFTFEVNLPDSAFGVYYIELTKIIGAGSTWALSGPLLVEYRE